MDESPSRKQVELELRQARIKLSAVGHTASASPFPEERERYERKAETVRGEIARLEAMLVELDQRAPAPAPPMPAPAPPRALSKSDSEGGVDATAFGAVAPIGDAMPFQPGAAAAPASSVADEPELAGATGFMAPLEDLDDPIPFEKKPPELSVEQYASLCVERALHPGRDTEVARRYRIVTEQALRTLDERWRQRFQAEGELYRRWQQAYAQYEAWLKSRG